MVAVPELGRAVADQVVQAADGSVKLVVTALDQWRQQPNQDPVAIVAHVSRSASAAALQELDGADRVLVGLLARTPGVDQPLLASLGGPDFVWRALEAGIPLRRQITGDIDVLDAPFYRAQEIEAATATRLASALAQRGRPLDAAGLLLDAGVPDRAARLLMDLPESVTKSVEPRAMLSVLARLGTVTDSEPGLLLLRANAAAPLGRLDQVIDDVDRAAGLAKHAEPPVRRRIEAAVARTEFFRGHRDRAIALASSGLRDIGPGEEHTFARAHEVLALATAASETRDDLQLAAESFRVAAAAWDACGESALARNCRCDLAMAVLIPLGRFDEALAVLAQVLAVPGLNDAERSWLMTYEGFALLESNRLGVAAEPVRSCRRPRIPAGQLDDRRHGGVGPGPHRRSAGRRGDDAEVDLHGGEHRPRRRRRSARRVVPVRRDHRARVRWVSSGSPSGTCAGRSLGPSCTTTRFAELDSCSRRAAARSATSTSNSTSPVRPSGGESFSCRRSPEREPAIWRRPGSCTRRPNVSCSASASLGSTHSVSVGPPPSCSSCCRAGTEPPLEQPVVDPRASARLATGGRRVRVIGGPIVVEDRDGVIEVPTGNPQRLVGVVVANGGVATFDQLAEAIWPGDDVETTRARLRNVLLRLRRGAGEVVARSGSGVRLASGVQQ